MSDDKALSANCRRLTLVDGSGFIFRAFHALPPMTNPEGTPINAVFGFVNMLIKLLDDNENAPLAVIFDSGRETFRNRIYPDYKANRPELPEELKPQFALVRDAVHAFNLPSVERAGFEADDIIATLARSAAKDGIDVILVSSDKDLMQLVGEKISMFDPLKNRFVRTAEVIEKFGVPPDKVIDVQALAGDASDNVPGVPGIGIKTAAQLISDYGDLENLLAHAFEIKQPKRRESLIANADAARLSKQLVTLRDDAPLSEKPEDFVLAPLDMPRLEAFLDRHGMKSIKARLTGRRGYVGAATPKETHQGAPETLIADYELITTIKALKPWIEKASAQGILSIDAETDSLDSMSAELVGISLALAPGRACYIPLRFTTGPVDLLDGGARESAVSLISETDALAALKPLLADDTVLKVGHNLKFDMQLFASRGVFFNAIEDTMVMSYVLDGAAHGHGMDELALLHLNYKTITFAELCGTGKARITFDHVPLDRALAYAAEDADITFRLYLLLKQRLLSERMMFVYERLDRPLVPILESMERAGIRIDGAELGAISREFAARMQVLEDEIQVMAGVSFNVASPKQVGEVLFERMGIPGGKKNKTGAYGADAEVLEKVAFSHPFAQKILDWRQIAKLKSTYADALVKRVNPKTGRVHTSFAMTATSTGRLASSDPNLQNIPIRTEEGRRIRRAFIADAGAVLLSADYSQIELRLVAHVAKIKALKEAFDYGADIHAITASHVFGVPVEGMDPMVRRRAKAINFGIIYGISPFGLARQLGISNGEARDYIDAYFRRYPEIKTYMEETRDFARKNGYVETLFGRKCPILGMNDKNPARRAFAERAAINAPIQGGGADIIKRAMIRLPQTLSDESLGAKMLLQVHDELLFETPIEEVEATKHLVKRVMEGAARLDVPLVVDVGVAGNWAEAH
ncbi:DNA polymerase I [Alphaproteobacteria bacterium]|nr:DNA polymerase I [Alphaproteobacteria bacterium]